MAVGDVGAVVEILAALSLARVARGAVACDGFSSLLPFPVGEVGATVRFGNTVATLAEL